MRPRERARPPVRARAATGPAGSLPRAPLGSFVVVHGQSTNPPRSKASRLPTSLAGGLVCRPPVVIRRLLVRAGGSLVWAHGPFLARCCTCFARLIRRSAGLVLRTRINFAGPRIVLLAGRVLLSVCLCDGREHERPDRQRDADDLSFSFHGNPPGSCGQEEPAPT